MGQSIEAFAEALVLMQHGEKCKRSEAQNSNNYNTQQMFRAQPAALAELPVAILNGSNEILSVQADKKRKKTKRHHGNERQKGCYG